MTEYLCQNCHETWSIHPPNGTCRDCGGDVVELTETTEQATLLDTSDDQNGGEQQ